MAIAERERAGVHVQTPVFEGPFDLLLHLLQHKGIVLSREQLIEQVWGFDFFGQTRTVDVHIAHLRDKLDGSGVEIETVWGIGYKLVVP